MLLHQAHGLARSVHNILEIFDPASCDADYRMHKIEMVTEMMQTDLRNYLENDDIRKYLRSPVNELGYFQRGLNYTVSSVKAIGSWIYNNPLKSLAIAGLLVAGGLVLAYTSLGTTLLTAAKGFGEYLKQKGIQGLALAKKISAKQYFDFLMWAGKNAVEAYNKGAMQMMLDMIHHDLVLPGLMSGLGVLTYLQGHTDTYKIRDQMRKWAIDNFKKPLKSHLTQTNCLKMRKTVAKNTQMCLKPRWTGQQ